MKAKDVKTIPEALVYTIEAARSFILCKAFPLVREWIKALFHRKKQLDFSELVKDIEKQKVKGRLILTSRPGPNMPKYQPCPQCQGDAKRNDKLEDSANYWCNKCKIAFYVRRPRRKPHIPVYQHSK